MERWATVKRLHQAALEREASQRAAFLDEACAGDEALRDEVESLLTYDQDAESFMELPAVEVTARNVSAELDTQLIGRTLSHYQVESLLGVGGMGEVYLARDPRLERSVALKILPPELALDADRMQRFIREAKAASALNHPNVATIYDVGESHGVRFIAMEHVEGHTLATRIAGRPLAPTDIVDIGAQVADALDAAHAKGITHRDIKPANLMLTPHGRVKVLDFGIAKTTRQESRTATSQSITGAQTAVGVAIGSAPYMSPEQVLGSEVDHRSDIFSLGVTLYEMATGRLPFPGTTTTETMDRILHGASEPITQVNGDLPLELERITFKCLEKDSTYRYQSARDLLVDLRNLKRQTDADLARRTIAETRRHNLPAQLTSFVGRGTEIAEIQRLLAGTRLLTLTGAGGCGKTRLALHAASELVEKFPEGVWVVDLSPLSEPDLVKSSVATVLNVQEGSQRSLFEVLSDYVRSRQLLLVLDNCEHLITACAHVAERLLRAGPGLHILATSRESLGLPGETVWRVPSLSLPSSQGMSAEAVAQSEAVRLFVDRATAVAPAFAISDAIAKVVAEICGRLDGIPLAIELAAAQMRMLSLDQVDERLKDRFRLLTGGSRTAVARQRTLEATVDWSYNLLSTTERRLLCRLSVFAGGWTFAAAEAVCAGAGLRKEAMLDLLSHLVDKSLVNGEEDAAGNRRYRFLETVRQYGRERLLRSRQVQRLRDRHLAFFLEVVRRAEPELQGPDQVHWLDRLEVEHDNLRAALEWSLTASEHRDEGLELAAALFWFWTKRGYFAEGTQWLERALAVDSRLSLGLRAKALVALSHMSYFRGDLDSASRELEESLRLGRQIDDPWAIAFSLFMQALVALEMGHANKALELATEAYDAARNANLVWLLGVILDVRAWSAYLVGDHTQLESWIDEALTMLRISGDKWGRGMGLNDLAALRMLQGLHAQTMQLSSEALVLWQELGERRGAAWAFENLAAAAAACGQADRAARLWGASAAMRESIGSPLPPTYQQARDRYLIGVKDSMGEIAFQTATSEGRAMSLTQAIQYALPETSSRSV